MSDQKGVKKRNFSQLLGTSDGLSPPLQRTCSEGSLVRDGDTCYDTGSGEQPVTYTNMDTLTTAVYGPEPPAAQFEHQDLNPVSSDITSLRQLILDMRSGMDARINDLENAVKKHVNDALDQKLEEIKRLIDTGVGMMYTRVGELERRVSSMEEKSTHEFAPEVSVVASGVEMVPDEDPMTVAQALVTNDLGLSHIRVVRATRTRQRVPTRPGILKIELKNTEDKINVLRSKINLKARRPGLFLHSAESHTDRLMRLNFETILRETPNGDKFKISGSGRVIPKDDGNQRRRDDNGAARRGPPMRRTSNT